MLRNDLEQLIGKRIPLTMVPDSESIFNIIIKESVSSEKRLIVDIKIARQEYYRGGISDVGWIKTTDNLDNGLTKFSWCQALESFVDTGWLDTTIQQWIVRREAERESDRFEDPRRETIVNEDRRYAGK